MKDCPSQAQQYISLSSICYVLFYMCMYVVFMGESSKFSKSCTFETPILKLAVCPLNIHNFNFNGKLSLDRLYMNRKIYYNLPNSAF